MASGHCFISKEAIRSIGYLIYLEECKQSSHDLHDLHEWIKSKKEAVQAKYDFGARADFSPLSHVGAAAMDWIAKKN